MNGNTRRSLARKAQRELPKPIPPEPPPAEPARTTTTRRTPGTKTAADLTRMAELETMLVRRVPFSSIAAHARLHWQWNETKVGAMRRRIYDRWAAESVSASRQVRRLEMRASLSDLYATAMAATTPVLDAEGRPVLDEHGEPLTRLTPDVRTAARIADLLCRLEGLYEPEVLEVRHSGEISFTLGRSRVELEHYAIHGTWPDGSVPELPSAFGTVIEASPVVEAQAS